MQINVWPPTYTREELEPFLKIFFLIEVFYYGREKPFLNKSIPGYVFLLFLDSNN